MENVKRILPYVRRYVLMAIYDVLDEESISYHKEEDAIQGRRRDRGQGKGVWKYQRLFYFCRGKGGRNRAEGRVAAAMRGIV